MWKTTSRPAELVAIQWGYVGATVGITVAYVSVKQVTPALTQKQIALYLKTVVGGVTLLTQLAAFLLDGSNGLCATTSTSSQGNEYEAHGMVIDREGRTFEIVLTVFRASLPEELTGFDAIMGAWRWAAA